MKVQVLTVSRISEDPDHLGDPSRPYINPTTKYDNCLSDCNHQITIY